MARLRHRAAAVQATAATSHDSGVLIIISVGSTLSESAPGRNLDPVTALRAVTDRSAKRQMWIAELLNYIFLAGCLCYMTRAGFLTGCHNGSCQQIKTVGESAREAHRP